MAEGRNATLAMRRRIEMLDNGRPTAEPLPPPLPGAHAVPSGLVHAAAIAAFVGTAFAAWLAQRSGFQVTAAIIFLLGVTIVGALQGMRGGVVAALVASAVYNFVLSEPTFRFSLASVDDYVPLIAFNVAAAASGLLAGRLKDRALAAELATRRLEALLNLSQRLQAAVGLEDVTRAVSAFAEAQGFGFELYTLDAGVLIPQQPQSDRADSARRLLESGMPFLREENEAGFVLSSTDTGLGVLYVKWHGRPPGEDRWEDLGGLANLVSIATERCLLLDKLAEAELVRKSEEFKTALLSSVSHDLRTPLTAISASASSLAQFGDRLPESAKADMLSMIQEQCDRLNRYTTNLLNLGRLQAGLDTDRFCECDAIEVLQAAIAHARERADGHDFVRAIEVAEALVRADPVMLEQLFYNVLENSLRYSEPGSQVTVHAALRRSALNVRIRDEGIGIPTADLERVFDRFYRANDRSSPEAAGLGLAIAKGFAEAFGGKIWAEPAGDVAGGTIVNIEIPALARAET